MSRSLYSKKIVLAVAFAFVMVTSAFVVSVTTNAASDKVQIKLQGWTLLPTPPGNPQWTDGDVKGYYEGNIVPIKLTMNRLDSSLEGVEITLGFEYGLTHDSGSTWDVRGFDRVVTYNKEPPVPPYNNPPWGLDPHPFEADGATISSQVHAASPYYQEGQWWDKWTVTFSFDQDGVYLRTGGLLYLTSPVQKGAAYFEGSKLSVRILELKDLEGKDIPGGGGENLPINVLETLGPPNLVVEKSCTPDVQAITTPASTIDFTIAVENIGQGNARLISLTDTIPAVIANPTSLPAVTLTFWYTYVTFGHVVVIEIPPTDLGPPTTLTNIPPDLPGKPGSIVMTWDFTLLGYPHGITSRGTGTGGAYYWPSVAYFKFTARVLDPGWPGEDYVNSATVKYTEWQDYLLVNQKDAGPGTCTFTLVKPDIHIEKWAQWDEPTADNLDTAERVNKAVAPYDSDGDGDVEAGDSFWYVIRVSNPSVPQVPEVDMSFYVTDNPPPLPTDLIINPPTPGVYPVIWTDGFIAAGGSAQWMAYKHTMTGGEISWDRWGDLFDDVASVYAMPDVGPKVFDSDVCYVYMLHPDMSITKTADRDIAKLGETIKYTIVVKNLDYSTYIDDVVVTDTLVYDDGTGGAVPLISLADDKQLWLKGSSSDTITLEKYHTVTASDFPADEPLVLSNTATVTGKAKAYLSHEYPISRADSEDVTLVSPDISITKTSETATVGSDMTVRYKIVVKNTGDTPLWYIFDDPMLTPTERVVVTGTDPSTPVLPLPTNWAAMYAEFVAEVGIAPGLVPDWYGYLTGKDDTDTQYFDHVLKSGEYDPKTGIATNTVEVLGWHNTQYVDNNWVWDSDQASVSVSGSIGGNVFHNRNLDFVWDKLTEEGLNDWKVQLYVKNDAGVFVPDGDPILTYSIWVDDDGDDTTPLVEVKGNYAFDGKLPNKVYKVREFLPTVGPEAGEWFVTYPKDADKTTYPYDEWSDELTVLGGHKTVQNFGNSMYGHITGCKFIDYDMNTVHDGTEPKYVGWVMWLSVHDDTDPDNWISQPTDENGNFDFKVLPGSYDLWEEDKDHWVHTNYIPTQNPVPGKIFAIDVLEGGTPTYCPICFGNIPTMTIWGYKFYDKDMDGVQDVDQFGNPIEPGLNGFTIRLAGDTVKEGDPAYDQTYQTIRKDGRDGYYEFVDVLPGSYVLSERPGPGWPGQAADWFITNLEIDPTAMDVVIDFSLPSVPDVPDDWQIDIGNMRYAKIDGYKFGDTYDGRDINQDGCPDNWPNGVFDSYCLGIGNKDEYGIGDWRINLAMWDGSSWVLIDHMTTLKGVSRCEKRGWYEFTELLPGRYKLWEQDRSARGWIPTTPDIVQLVVPEHPWGSPVVIRVDFGNIMPMADPEIPFVLEAGNNMWSSPVTTNGLTAKGLLALIGPDATSITTVNPATGGWISYVKDLPSRFDFPIIQGHAYYIYAEQRVEFALVGEFLDSSQVPLVAGWNLIGLNQMEPVMASKLMTMVSGCTATTVSVFDVESGKWVSYVSGLPARFDLNVVPGVGYLLYVDGAGVLSYT